MGSRNPNLSASERAEMRDIDAVYTDWLEGHRMTEN